MKQQRLKRNEGRGTRRVLPQKAQLMNGTQFRKGSRAITILTVTLLLLLAVTGAATRAATSAGPWRQVEEGLMIGEFDPGSKPGAGSNKVLVLRIDPQQFTFRLMAASEHAGRKLNIKEWCEHYQLLGAFNAGMYAKDGFTSVGFMKNFKHVNNGRLNRYNAVLAFNPVDASVPEIQVIDRECQDFAGLRGKYQTFVQSIRMVSCLQQNVWSPQAEGWSTLAIGMDKSNRVLVIFCQQPMPVHDLINILLKLPLSLHNAMYLEGGPQASLYLATSDGPIERHGSWQASGDGSNHIQVSWPIPNVIGIVRKP